MSNLLYADQDTAVIEKEISVTDERQKVSITVEKQDAETGNTVAGAVFGIYNAKDIQTKDGKVIVKADTLLQKMTSDEKGQAACTLDLPLGSYYVKELKAPDGFVSSDEVLRFDASYQGQDVQTVTLKSVKKNQPTTVEITKSDATTGVELDGAYLKVTDKDGNVVDSWTSSKDAPHVIKYLKVGETYTLHEEFAPHGYLVANDVTFTVKDTGEVQKVEMKDEVPVGELIINKKGEFLDSVTLADKVKGVVEHIFNYVTGKLTDVTFEVYAEEDIKAADGVSDDYYKKDELIATIKTDETGIAKLENLPLGKYYVKETGTAYGHVLDGEIRHVDLTYVDQNTPVVVYDKDWQNNRQRVEVSVLKKEKDSDRTLEGAIFGLFAKEDIKSETTGKVLIEADEIIELKSTDEEGKITFVADLPIGATYYVKELYAPDGFVTNDEVKEFTFEYAGEDQPTVTYSIKEKIVNFSEDISRYDAEINKYQIELNRVMEEDDVTIENIVAFKSGFTSIEEIDSVITEIDNQITKLQGELDSGAKISEEAKKKRQKFFQKFIEDMNTISNVIEGTTDKKYNDIFTKRGAVISGSEETVFYISKLLATVRAIKHECPIIMDSFRAEDLSTEKENRALDLFIKLDKQCILTTTIKEEEKGKYDSFPQIHIIDYTEHTTNKLLSPDYNSEFTSILGTMNILLK